jgi:hypothetical protein
MEQEINIQTSTKELETTALLLADGFFAARKRRCGPVCLWEGAAVIGARAHNIGFADNDHLEFYAAQSDRLNPDRYLKALIYTLGICPDTRRRFSSLYDDKDKSIVPGAIHSPWQTSSSLKVTRLAFQLFTDVASSAFLSDGNPDFDECARHSVTDIFCCSYAPYFVEAIKLRYPEYMGMER